MSSPSPLPSLEPLQKKKFKDKNKKKPKNSNVITTVEQEQGKHGINPHWDYVPPEGTILLEHDIDSGDFDWDAVKNDDNIELWLVRVPDGVKPKYLETVQIDVPSSSRSATVGLLNRKHVSYDIWSIGDDDDQTVGGEEIRGLSCLLPRKKKNGRLYKAPKPIARHLVLSAQDISPTPDPSVHLAADSVRTYQNVPRQSYPREVLKHRFMPYGSRITQGVDVEVEVGIKEKDPTGEGASPGKNPRGSKGKKRKVEGDTPKKAKKVKIVI